VLGLQNVDYVANSARDLGEEIEFKPGGSSRRAPRRCSRARASCSSGSRDGPVRAIDGATFGDVSRKVDEGRGSRGSSTPTRLPEPVTELMGQASYA